MGKIWENSFKMELLFSLYSCGSIVWLNSDIRWRTWTMKTDLKAELEKGLSLVSKDD